MNPLDWTAEPFLILYTGVASAALLLLILWRDRLATGQAAQDLAGLDVLHLAYLAGGPARVMDTALVGLFQADAIRLNGKGRIADVSPRSSMPPSLRDYCPGPRGDMDRKAYHKAFLQRGAALHAALARRGLLVPEPDTAAFRTVSLAVLAIPLILGASKIAVGLSRGRPVGILAVLMAVTALAGLLIRWKPYHRTKAGSAALAQARRDNARAARAPLEPELMLAFALTGSDVLLGRTYRDFFRPASGGSSDSGGSDSGGGGDGGGGCGGCSA